MNSDERNCISFYNEELIGDLRARLEELVFLLGHDLQLGETRIPFSVESITLHPSICFSPNEQAMAIVPRLERGDRYVLCRRWIEPPSEAEIRLLTPLRLRHKGQLLTAFDPEIFFRRLWDRLQRYTPTGGKREKGGCQRSPHFEPLTLRQGGKKWFDLEGLSYDQKKTNPLSGLIGRVRFGPLTPELWALLHIGEVFHVGEKTAFGLGRYQILNG